MSATPLQCGMEAAAAGNIADFAGGVDSGYDNEAVGMPFHLARRGEAFTESMQRHRLAQAETNEYLERTVAEPLSQGLAAMALKQPLDPVDYLVQWLYRYADEQENKEVQAAERARLLKARAAVKARHEEELRVKAERAATYDSKGLTKEDRVVLSSLDSATWLSEKEFQWILNHLKSALGVTAAYMVQVCEVKDSPGQVLQYVGADTESHFLVDMTLKEDEGVLWDALPEADESEGNPIGDSEDSESDDDTEKEKRKVEEASMESAHNEDTSAEESQPKGKVGKPFLVADVMSEERVKFWRMVRPGSLAAVSLVYEDPANKASVDAVKEYLLKVQKRNKFMEERESARKQAASKVAGSRKSLSKRNTVARGSQSKRNTLSSEVDLSDAEGSDEEQDYDRHTSDIKEGEEITPPPVPPPTYALTTTKIVFCVDTLGLDEPVSPLAVKRLSHFVASIREHCIRTRLAAVYAQAEEGMDDEKNKERAEEIAKGLAKLDTDIDADIEVEKTLALERLEAKLQEEKEERVQRKQARLQKAEEDKLRRREELSRKRAERAQVRQRKRETLDTREPVDIGGESSEGEKDGEGETSGDEPSRGEGQAEAREEDEDGAADTKEEQSEEENDSESEKEEADEEDPDEDEAMEMLSPTFFLEQAEAKVRYEKTCDFLRDQYAEMLAHMKNMFIPLAASAKPILAACLLLLGEPPSSLRLNSKLPETDWDWQKLRSKTGASFVERLSGFDPAAPRPPPPADSAPSTELDVALLYQIVQIIEDVETFAEEPAILLETSPPLYLLDRWAKLAIDYRRKFLTVRAATIFREAKRKKKPPPHLEAEIDMDFQSIPLPQVLSAEL